MQSLTSSVYTKKYTKRTQTIEMIGSLQKHKQIAHQQMLLRWLNFGSLQKHTQIAGKQNEIQMFEPIIDYAEYVDNTSVASLFDKTSAKFFFTARIQDFSSSVRTARKVIYFTCVNYLNEFCI